MDLRRSLNGAFAGGLAAGLWAAQQPLDKRIGGSSYDDVELLGKLVTRGPGWPAAGAALHVANGALFGAVYAQIRPFLPGPPVVRGLLAAQVEHVGLFPLGAVVDRVHPARDELEVLGGNGRAFAQATWRHAIFGVVLGLLEARLNAERHAEPPAVEVSSNGYGDIEAAVGAVGASH
ncbi:MAG: hypothetical protein AVDCRST_MAG17-1654 [uncultured Solirubrobacterales bacterium]|uniref:DUF1440 domain-containing protein n=1 Tax=uncultured Solirubrobacterales bacterium TaxID=768556 RepID=A0A6J4SUC3_9ACTN|nr:MAG: hypothetical protein AVDCRST_MAG17-1654 [uncultured Solirubrobacterales bacterium]